MAYTEVKYEKILMNHISVNQKIGPKQNMMNMYWITGNCLRKIIL